MRRTPIVLTALLLATFVPAARAAESTTVTALLPIATTAAMAEIIPLYERSHSGVRIQTTFANVNSLAVQIESGGSDADMIMGGGPTMTRLHEHSKIGTLVPVYAFHQVVIVPKGSTKVRALRDLANPGVRIAIATAGSSTGQYQRQILRLASAKFGADFERKVMANVVTTKSSSAEILAAVKGGVADAAIEASASPPDVVDVIPIPAEANFVTVNSAAVVSSAPHAAAAQAFVDFLRSAEGQALFHKYRFDSPH